MRAICHNSSLPCLAHSLYFNHAHVHKFYVYAHTYAMVWRLHSVSIHEESVDWIRFRSVDFFAGSKNGSDVATVVLALKTPISTNLFLNWGWGDDPGHIINVHAITINTNCSNWFLVIVNQFNVNVGLLIFTITRTTHLVSQNCLNKLDYNLLVFST